MWLGLPNLSEFLRSAIMTSDGTLARFHPKLPPRRQLDPSSSLRIVPTLQPQLFDFLMHGMHHPSAHEPPPKKSSGSHGPGDPSTSLHIPFLSTPVTRNPPSLPQACQLASAVLLSRKLLPLLPLHLTHSFASFRSHTPTGCSQSRRTFFLSSSTIPTHNRMYTWHL